MIHKLRYPIQLTILAILLQSGLLNAQEKTMSANAPAVVQVNQAFNYTVSGEVQGDVSIKTPDGIRIMRGPSQMVSYQSSNVNGKLQNTMQVSYTYLLVAEKEGEYEIPPAELRADGKTYNTNPVKIKVTRGASGDQEGGSKGPPPVILSLEPSRTSIYEGEQILVETRVFYRERIRLTALNSPEYQGFWSESLDPDNFASNQTRNGISYRTQVIKRDLITAQKKGEINLGRSTMDVDIQKQVRTNRPSSPFDDFFSDPFFNSPNRYETISRTFTSNPLIVEVKPLPSGAPASFNGAVGDIRVQAGIDADSVEVNNALNLKVTINGKGNLALLSAPDIDFPPDLEVFEPKRINNISHSASGTSGRVEFEYLIIPRFPGEYRIAPVEYSWFDPNAQTYRSYASSGFNFIASGNAETGQDGLPAGGLFREDVRNLNVDIRFIRLNPGNLRFGTSLIVSIDWIYYYFAGGFFFLAAFMFFWRRRVRRKTDIFHNRSRKARKIAVKRLGQASKYLKNKDEHFYEEVLNALWGYLGDRLGISAAELSREKVVLELKEKNVDDRLSGELVNIIEECEQSRYSPLKSDQMDTLFRRATNCIEDLEQLIK